MYRVILMEIKGSQQQMGRLIIAKVELSMPFIHVEVNHARSISNTSKEKNSIKCY